MRTPMSRCRSIFAHRPRAPVRTLCAAASSSSGIPRKVSTTTGRSESGRTGGSRRGPPRRRWRASWGERRSWRPGRRPRRRGAPRAGSPPRGGPAGSPCRPTARGDGRAPAAEKCILTRSPVNRTLSVPTTVTSRLRPFHMLAALSVIASLSMSFTFTIIPMTPDLDPSFVYSFNHAAAHAPRRRSSAPSRHRSGSLGPNWGPSTRSDVPGLHRPLPSTTLLVSPSPFS